MNRHAMQFVFFFGTILAMSLATGAFAQSSEEQAVLAPIHAMIDGMSKRDAAAIKAPSGGGSVGGGGHSGGGGGGGGHK